jgi:hypothetical protein
MEPWEFNEWLDQLRVHRQERNSRGATRSMNVIMIPRTQLDGGLLTFPLPNMAQRRLVRHGIKRQRSKRPQ